jgi:hypothetical protein
MAFARIIGMKQNLVFATLVAATAAALSWYAPQNVRGAGETDFAVRDQLVADIAAQQEVLSANQTKIDAKLAEIEENIRVARIYSSRSGKGPTQ